VPDRPASLGLVSSGDGDACGGISADDGGAGGLRGAGGCGDFNKATANMSCVSGVCSPTAAKAVLNAIDLTNMLAGGDVKVTTGSGATNIVVKDGFSWTSTSRLTLDAMQSVEVDQPVSVAGSGAATITTSDGGSGGEFSVLPEKGSIQFWDLSSSLIIDGNSYTLAGDIKTLAANIAANPSGFHALAKPYDASVDGTFASPPIANTFSGTFDGLGNAISHFRLRFGAGEFEEFGFLKDIGVGGVVRNFGLVSVDIAGTGSMAATGTLAAGNEGVIQSCWTTGLLVPPQGQSAGGLVDANGGTISRSLARVQIRATNPRYLGGLIAYNAGLVSQSYADGLVEGSNVFNVYVGGLVGVNAQDDGNIENSYSIARVRATEGSDAVFGGLVGWNQSGATITAAYAAGPISEGHTSQSGLAGLIGQDDSRSGSVANSYWDLDKGVSDPSQGAGNIKNDPGVTGLTTRQLQKKLPLGFDHAVWGLSEKENHELPYLIGISAH
jgi:hypothetical protein